MIKAHVICCNDSAEFVVLEDVEQAKEKLEQLATEYFDKNQHSMTFYNMSGTNYNEYRNTIRWHIRTVEAIGVIDGGR